MEKLEYKIKNGPRVESVNEFILSDDTKVAMFQGFRGSYPDLDFIVKYGLKLKPTEVFGIDYEDPFSHTLDCGLIS